MNITKRETYDILVKKGLKNPTKKQVKIWWGILNQALVLYEQGYNLESSLKWIIENHKKGVLH